MHIYDDFIYYQQQQPVEIIKLDLQGNVVKCLKKYGEGPGEFVNSWGMSEYRGDIAFIDTTRMKLLIYSKDLEFSRETKMRKPFMDFFVNKKNEIVFFNGTEYSDYYFQVYSEDAIKPQRKFGKRITTLKDEKKKKNFDSVRAILYLPGKDELWVSFKNRYDLRYYENEKLSVEIKGPKGFFKGEEQEAMGRKYMLYHDRSTHLDKVKNQLFYLFAKDDSTFCDIFDLENYSLKRRIRFKNNYRTCVSHWKENIFYGVCYDEDSEDNDVILYRIEIKNSQF